jgi:formylglycine-generating enzyme required for sulfatase activity
LDSSTGLISGTPIIAGNFNFTVRVTDANGLIDDQSLWLAVAEGPGLGVGFGPDQFATILSGQFQMGSTNGNPDELPVHSVNITQSFEMQKTEVTQTQWIEVMGTNPSHHVECGHTCPVEGVSWNDIQEFLTALNVRYPGSNYRLPTEAEWEFAARAGTTGDFGGTGNIDDMGWYAGNSSDSTHPVAQKQPNAWGLYDMHGNVFEWVQDWYAPGYYAISPEDDPPGPAGPVIGDYHVLRGGGFGFIASVARSARRGYTGSDDRGFGNAGGFRLVRGGGG